MKALAVIPARGGSQRIKNKNIRPFLGVPIIEYAIRTAIQSKLFERVIVSTDSETIKSVAEKAGADVPFLRPANLSDHFTGTHAVTEHAVATLACAGESFDAVCCIYATNPLLTVAALAEGFQRLQSTKCHHVVSIAAFDFPIQRGLTKDGYWVTPIDSEMMSKRSQDLPECWHDAAQFYWSRTDALSSPLWGGYTQAISIPRMQVQDIDTLEDWQLAECKYQMLNGAVIRD